MRKNDTGVFLELVQDRRIFTRRHWIPPGALAFGYLSIGASWILLYRLAYGQLPGQAVRPELGIGFVHLAGLGGITMIALGISFHVLPAFTGIRWRWERVARSSLIALGLGAWTMVLGFLSGKSSLLALGIPLVGAGLALWLCSFFYSLYTHAKSGAIPGPAWILIGPAVFLTFAGSIGFLMGETLAGHALFPNMLGRFPFVHAMFALFGWLTLLVVGVSSRTIVPIAGQRSRHPSLRLWTSGLLTAGLLFYAGGVLISSPLSLGIGGFLLFASILSYVADIAPLLAGARKPHRVPQLFFASGLLYLLGACAVGGEILFGHRPWKDAFVFLLLMGWLVQIVAGHLHHIGIRLIATIVRGDLDQTPPERLLDSRISALSFWALQGALLAGSVGLLAGMPTALELAALLGTTGWIAIAFNVRHAWSSARTPDDPVTESRPANPMP
jgi:hypothetical protein